MNDYDTNNILQLFSCPRTWTLKIEKMYRCAMLVGSVALFCFGALHVRIGIGHPKKTPVAASMIRSLRPGFWNRCFLMAFISCFLFCHGRSQDLGQAISPLGHSPGTSTSMSVERSVYGPHGFKKTNL